MPQTHAHLPICLPVPWSATPASRLQPACSPSISMQDAFPHLLIHWSQSPLFWKDALPALTASCLLCSPASGNLSSITQVDLKAHMQCGNLKSSCTNCNYLHLPANNDSHEKCLRLVIHAHYSKILQFNKEEGSNLHCFISTVSLNLENSESSIVYWAQHYPKLPATWSNMNEKVNV